MRLNSICCICTVCRLICKIIVLNNKSRVLDNTLGILLVLLELRRNCLEVLNKIEVFINSSIRRGSDVLKAVMIGGRGVGIGRPFQCAVMYCRNGVEHLCDSEFRRGFGEGRC